MNRTPERSIRRRQNGITLIESAITASVLATVMGVAVPNFKQMRELRHIEGAAALLETDIQHTRSLAVANNQTVRISFETGPAASCYVVHTGSSGACSCIAGGDAVCVAGAEGLRTVRYGAGLPLRLQSNSRSIAFDPDKGTVTPTATVRVIAQSGATIHQVVNVMGRVRSCSPAPGVAGYRPC